MISNTHLLIGALVCCLAIFLSIGDSRLLGAIGALLIFAVLIGAGV